MEKADSKCEMIGKLRLMELLEEREQENAKVVDEVGVHCESLWRLIGNT
jgi:hypothetical protein